MTYGTMRATHLTKFKLEQKGESPFLGLETGRERERRGTEEREAPLSLYDPWR